MKKELLGALLITCMLVSCGGLNSSSTTYETEPNPYGNEQQISTSGIAVIGSIDDLDEDAFYFDGIGGIKYDVSVNWISGENLYLHAWWYAYDRNCFWSYSTPAPKMDIQDTINMGTYSGRCYLLIRSNNPGTYSISVKENRTSN